MSQATRPSDRHIIWSNQNLDVDDWREDYKEFLEANELDDDPNDEQALYEWMEETNYDYLSDERVNLNVQLSQPIIVIGDIGRWNGRVMGYKDIPSGNIRDCLYADTDYTYAPMEPPLPPMCYSVLPSTGEVIQIDRWQKGYTATSFNDGNRAENEAIKDKFNEKLGVTKAQEQAMLAGSMIRWDSIAAKPKSFDENGKAIKPKDYER